MMLLAVDFDNLHQVLSNLYEDMMPLCSEMTGVAKGLAGLGALFYVANRVWQALSRAEPIDVYPLLRPFALGLCIMFFPTIVLGTINAVMSPIVKGTHNILAGQMLDLDQMRKDKEELEYEAMKREGKEWLVNNEVYDKKMDELGIRDFTEIVSMWSQRTWYNFKKWCRQLIRDFLEFLFNSASLVIDTIRTFFLVVLSILGPIAFAFAVYDGFHASLTQWLSRYLSVYLWLPVSDLFSAVMAKIQVLMVSQDKAMLNDPSFVPDSSNGVYIVFMLIGIIGFFTIPTVSNWIVQSGGMGSANSAVNKTATKGGAYVAGAAGGAVGNVAGRLMGRGRKK